MGVEEPSSSMSTEPDMRTRPKVRTNIGNDHIDTRLLQHIRKTQLVLKTPANNFPQPGITKRLMFGQFTHITDDTPRSKQVRIRISSIEIVPHLPLKV